MGSTLEWWFRGTRRAGPRIGDWGAAGGGACRRLCVRPPRRMRAQGLSSKGRAEGLVLEVCCALPSMMPGCRALAPWAPYRPLARRPAAIAIDTTTPPQCWHGDQRWAHGRRRGPSGRRPPCGALMVRRCMPDGGPGAAAEPRDGCELGICVCPQAYGHLTPSVPTSPPLPVPCTPAVGAAKGRMRLVALASEKVSCPLPRRLHHMCFTSRPLNWPACLACGPLPSRWCAV